MEGKTRIVDNFADYSDLEKDTVLKYVKIKSDYCLSVSNMLCKLEGIHESHPVFADYHLAEAIFEKARDDIMDLAKQHSVYFLDKDRFKNEHLIAGIVLYKKTRLESARMAVVAAIKIIVKASDPEVPTVGYMKAFLLPCKF